MFKGSFLTMYIFGSLSPFTDNIELINLLVSSNLIAADDGELVIC